MAGMIEMSVEQDGEKILHYTFGSIVEASEMLAFLRDFFPDSTFTIQPVRH